MVLWASAMPDACVQLGVFPLGLEFVGSHHVLFLRCRCLAVSSLIPWDQVTHFMALARRSFSCYTLDLKCVYSLYRHLPIHSFWKKKQLNIKLNILTQPCWYMIKTQADILVIHTPLVVLSIPISVSSGLEKTPSSSRVTWILLPSVEEGMSIKKLLWVVNVELCWVFCSNMYVSYSPSGHFGLWLDETLYLGRSSPCYTFNNCCLSETGDFRVLELEAWTFCWSANILHHLLDHLDEDTIPCSLCSRRNNRHLTWRLKASLGGYLPPLLLNHLMHNSCFCCLLSSWIDSIDSYVK